jgi:hypothetical protein
MIVRTALASALALGALTSAALAEEPAKELLQLTDAQMDGVTAGQVLTNTAAVVAFALGGTLQTGGNSVTSNNSISQSNTIDIRTTSGGG